jgi:hypothetical protein
MAKITRKVAKLFGSSAGPTQVGQFGSLAAASPTYSSDPTVIQGLSNWAGGWFSAIIGNNSPAIEDMNGMCLVFAYQLAYLMQEGVPEWDSSTTYYIGSIAQDGSANLYRSLTNSNLNNALSDGSNWALLNPPINVPTVQVFATNGSYSYNPTYYFQVAAAANATAGATYTNNSHTYTVSTSITLGFLLQTTGTGAPTAGGTLTLASGTGDATITFSGSQSPVYCDIEMVGAGGGGYGTNNATGGGSDGTATTFGSLLIAGPGLQGNSVGGSPTVNSPAIALVTQAGAGGQVEMRPTNGNGGAGGASFFGGGGPPGQDTVSAINAVVSGSGGGGAGDDGAHTGGYGGSAGAYIKARVLSPTASVAVVIGLGGAATTAGTFNGGAGADGYMSITEYFS